MAQVYYAFEHSTYRHYLFGEQRILQFNMHGKECIEIPYTYLPVMRYMTPVNVVSTLLCTDGGTTHIEIAYSYGAVFNKFSVSQTELCKCVQLGTRKNCIISLERRIAAGVLQTIHVYNNFETELFNQLMKGIL